MTSLTFQDFVACKLDKGDIVLLYSADLSAAFEMIRPEILIKICLKKGYPELMPFDWILLNEQLFNTKINNVLPHFLRL
jgi:hypothetical protein